MARYSASTNKTVFIHESGTYATTSGAGVWPGLVQSCEFNETLNLAPERYTGGDRSAGQFVQGGRSVEGTLTYHPQDFRLLGFALGSIVDAGSPSPYTHELKALHDDSTWTYTSGALNPFASFTIEDSRAATGTGNNFIRTANGCIIDEWSVNWKQGGILECNANFTAQRVTNTSGASTAVTAVTTRPFLWRDVKVHIPSGTVVATVSEGNFSIKNNLDKDTYYSNGSDVRQSPMPGNLDVSLELTKRSDSEWAKTLYETYFKGGSSFNCMLEVNDASAGAGSRDAYFTLSGCRVDPLKQASPVSGMDDDVITIMAPTVSVLVNDTTLKYAPW